MHNSNVPDIEKLDIKEALVTKLKTISFVIDSSSRDALLADQSTPRDKARIRALCLKGAGAWLHTVPNKAMGLHLYPQELATQLRLTLGLPIFHTAGLCPAGCGLQSDIFGVHAIQCSYRGERIHRHNQLRDIFYHTASDALLRPTREERNLLPDSERKPGDVFISGWAHGRDVALDSTVTSPLQLSLVHKAADIGGHAADQRFRSKIGTYWKKCNQEAIEFIPLVIETHGGWHPKSMTVIRRLASQLASHWSDLIRRHQISSSKTFRLSS